MTENAIAKEIVDAAFRIHTTLERAQETCDSATRLCTTLPQPLAITSPYHQPLAVAGSVAGAHS